MSTALQTGDNVLGAITFFAYIFAALLLTGLIISDNTKLIIHNPPKAPNTRSGRKPQPENHGQAKLKAICMLVFATLGFAQLSWNMLGVLIVSYHNWALRNGISYPKSLVGKESVFHVRVYVWCWATQSTLFRDFAEDLMRSDEIWAPVRLSLLWTMVGNVVASFYVLENYLTFPNLWAYCAVQQILPPSFAQNLLLAAQFLVPPDPAQRRRLRWPHMFTTLFSTIAFIGAIFFARKLVNALGIFVVLVIIRSLLIIPFFISWRYQESHGDDPQNSAALHKSSKRPAWTEISVQMAAVLLGLLQYDRQPSSFAERALVDDFQILRFSLLALVVFRVIDMRWASPINVILAVICARGMHTNMSSSFG